jgi:hypothetical protein
MAKWTCLSMLIIAVGISACRGVPRDVAIATKYDQLMKAGDENLPTKCEVALKYYQGALPLKKDDWYVHNRIGRAHMACGRLDHAITAFRAANTYRETALTYVDLGEAQSRKGNRAEANLCFRKAVALEPEQWRGYLALGEEYSKSGLYDAAIETLSLGLTKPSREEDKARLKNALAQAQLAKGQTLPSPPGAGLPTVSSARPTLQIHRIEVPARVAPGAAFDLKIQYTATDPSSSGPEIPVQLVLSILEGETVLFTQPAIGVNAPNGLPAGRVEHLNAASKKGMYTIKSTLRYKGSAVEESAAFGIE